LRLRPPRRQRHSHRRQPQRAQGVPRTARREHLPPVVMAPTVLGVVTARAGSKGLPGKNTRLLAGEPLLAYTIDAAREAHPFDRLILSSDDERAAEIARERGCEVPFVRPAELAADDTPHLPVMQHAVAWLRDRERYLADWTMILMPTSPLRRPRHIAESVALAFRSGADSVVSVDEIPDHYNPARALTVDAHGWARPLDGRPVPHRPPPPPGHPR